MFITVFRSQNEGRRHDASTMAATEPVVGKGRVNLGRLPNPHLTSYLPF